VSQESSIFRIRAHNTAADSENKIHDDRVAAAYGFRGGLVPGVTVYGYMIPAVLEQFGPGWLEQGGISVRFVGPCYEGAAVLASCDGSVVRAEAEDGSLYATGTVTQDDAPTGQAEAYPGYPLPPAEQRPVASSETIRANSPLGSISQILDVTDKAAIPERLLRMANEILVRNFMMSPWIHAGSQVRHHHLPALGQEITVRGAVLECFERKARRFAVAGLAMSAEERPIATVRHTFIYSL
jgi:acyl dehydratase